MTKIKVLLLVGSLVGLFSAVAHGAEKRGHKAKKGQDVVYIDASTPDKPESQFPDMVKKGSL